MQKILLGLLAISTLFACNDINNSQTLKLSKRGYPYQMLNNVDGENVKPGQVGKFHFTMMKGDSVIINSKDRSPEPNPFMVPEDINEDKKTANIIIDALTMMSKGDCLSIYQPLDTLKQLPQGFSNSDSLRYDIVLVDIVDGQIFEAEQKAQAEKAQAAMALYQAREEIVADSMKATLKSYKKGAKRAGFQTTASGLKYKILEKGNGPLPTAGKPVLVSYYGVLASDGNNFDNSFKRGRPFEFILGQGQVIKGWDEGIALLPSGTRAVLAIPSDLGYGANGSGTIPANSELLFYVQLEDIAK